MAPTEDFFRGRAGEDFDDVVHANPEPPRLPHPVNAGEHFLRGQRGVVALARLEAIVACAAIRRRVVLREIPQQLDPPAGRALGEIQHQAQLLAGDPLLVFAAHLVDEVRLLRRIAGTKKQ